MRNAFREINYEVHLAEGNRWSIETALPRKGDALAYAQELLGGKRGEAVRVVKEVEGKKPEIIFEEAREEQKEAYLVAAIDEAPLCADITDFYALPARRTAARVYRAYLDGKGWTALEVLHDVHKLKDLARDERFLYQGLQRIAAVQARTAGDDAGERTEALEQIFGLLRDRAREAPATEGLLEVLDAEGLDAVVAKLSPQGPSGKGDRLDKEGRIRVGAVLAAGLGRCGDWMGKAGWLLDLLRRGTVETDGVALLDEVLAEILDGNEAVRDFLGGQADLASALSALTLIATGRSPERFGAESPARRLAATVAVRALPKTRETLLARVAANLSGVRPLTREHESADRHALVDLLGKLQAPAGLWGGQAVSEAATLRTRMLFGKDGDDLPLPDTIRLRLDTLPSRAQKLGYLLDLTATRLWEPGKAVILEALMTQLAGISHIRDLATPGAPVPVIRDTVADLLPRFENSALPPEAGQLFSTKLSSILKAAGVAADVAEQGTASRAPKPDDKPAKTATGRCRVAAGNYLFRQGDLGDEAYVVMSGELDIIINAPEGERRIDSVRRGDLVGEMAIVDDQPRMASVRAKVDSELVVIPRDVFQAKLNRVLDGDHVVRQLVETFVTRLRNRPVL